MNKDLKKEIIKIIVFAIGLVFLFIYIKPIWGFLGKIVGLIMPFIIGLVIAFVLNILVSFIERKIFNKSKVSDKFRHNISIVLSLAIVLSAITFIFILVIPQIKNTATIFINNLPYYQENVTELLESVGVNADVRASILAKSKDITDEIVNYLDNNSGKIVSNALGVASGVVSSVVNIGIAFVFAIYLLIDKNKLLRQSKKLLRAYIPKKKISKLKEIFSLSNKTFANFVSGQLTEALIIGVLCFIGMLILRIPYSATIAVLVGFTAIIPVFGAFIGTIIGAFLIFMVSPIKALIFIIFILLLQQCEGNLIYPKVVGKSVNLPSIWVLFAVTVGASISGVIGMLLSVPIVSILYSVMATSVNSRLKKLDKKRKN